MTGVSVIEKSEQIQGEHVYQASTLVVCIASAVIASASQRSGRRKAAIMTRITFEITLDQLAADQLAELETATGRSEAALLSDAIRWLYRLYIGDSTHAGSGSTRLSPSPTQR